MKLAINDSGSWRNVMDFDVKDVEAVKTAALRLLCFAASVKFPRLQISDSLGPVLHYTAVDGWKVPAFAKGREWLP